MKPLEQKLLRLLSNNDVTFFIPPYQRNYEWTDEQCRVFWDDVVKTCTNNTNGVADEHFFGTITYFQDDNKAFGEPDKLVLIDGQQRITTTMLFLVAVRDVLDDSAAIRATIDKKYLKNENVTGDSEYKVKLKQVETDWETYKDIILGNHLSDKAKQSAVYQNYRFFCNELKKYIENDGNTAELISKGLDKFSIVTIELKPQTNKWENPQEIFESMNSLGKPLSLADLVRNYLLLGLNAEDQTKYYNRYWLQIEKAIPGEISNFIRDYMQCTECVSFEKASEKNYKSLYSEFKRLYKDRKPAAMLGELDEYAALYSYILGSKTISKKVDEMLADFRSIRVTTANSFILSLLYEWNNNRLEEKDLLDILGVFRIYCFRRRLASVTQGENKVFPTFTKKISELKSASDKKMMMFEFLSKQENSLRLPNDLELIDMLKTMNFASFMYKKLYLSLVEEKLTKSRPIQNDPLLQVEHIMPQTLNDEWTSYLGENADEIHQKYVDNIGNLTLIRHNQELGQKLFDIKKKTYIENSGLQIAKTQITDVDQWNEKAITERLEWITEFIVSKVLPIPEEMKNRNNYTNNRRGGLSFDELQIIGEYINFASDPTIKAKVVADKKVEFEGKIWKLSPLTAEIRRRNGTATQSEAYQGAKYWEYDGMLLSDLI